MFKKLFTIDFNNKKFLILVDKYHRKTFLEVTDDGKYNYPEYEDYKELNEIYNNYDYTIKYDYKFRLMTYQEKVRYKSSLLACNILLSAALSGYVGITGKWILDLDDIEKKSLSIKFQQLYKDTSYDRALIDNYYNNEVITRDDVVAVINNNDNLSDYYKQIAIQVLDLNLELDPEINLRIYYENMKDMRISVQPWEVISKNNARNYAGYFTPVARDIYLCQDYAHDDQTVAHEFTHAVHNLIDSSRKDIIFIHETRGYSLEEAMTNRIISNLWGYHSSYNIQQKLLSFLIDNVDDFNYHIYNENGIMGLIDELKDKYPEIDIDYIIDYIDTYTRTDYIIGNNQLDPFKDMEFVNELFNIVINNIDKDDIYRTFDSFMKMFDNNDIDFYNMYYSLFNNELVMRRYIDKNTFEFINKINNIICVNGNFYLSDSDNSYINYNGNKIFINGSENVVVFPLIDGIKPMMIQDAANGIEINTYDYMKKIIPIEITNREFRNIIIELEDNKKNVLVDDIFTLVTKDIDLKNLYGTFNSFSKILLSDDYLYNKCDDYLEKYNYILIQNGLISMEQMSQIISIHGFIESNGKIYAYSNIDDDFLTKNYGSVWIKNDNIGTEQNYLRFNNNFIFNCINNDGIFKKEFSEKYLSVYSLGIDGYFAIVQYLFENPTDNIFSQDYLRQMAKNLNMFSEINCNTFSDGAVAFNMQDIPNMYVEIGNDEDNNVGLMLFNQDKLIYGTCKSFSGNTYKIPFDLYLRLSHLAINEPNIENVISSKYLDVFYKYILNYLIPNVEIKIEKNERYDENNELVYEYNTKYMFNKLRTAFVDGKEGYLRHIILSENINGDLIINFFDGDEVEVCHIMDPKYNSLSDEIYYETFDTCIDYLNIKPNNGDGYNFSKQEVIDIVNEYLNAVISNDKNQDSNTAIKR